MAFHPADVRKVIGKHARAGASARERARCPKCARAAGSRQEVAELFGFRSVGGIARPQSWCRECRTGRGGSRRGRPTARAA